MTTTYEKIATTTLSSATNSITFSSITASYTDLRLVLTTTGISASDYIYMRFNADGAGVSTYSSTHLYGGGASAGSFKWNSTNGIHMHGIGALTTTPNVLITTDIFSYAGSTNKTLLGTYSSDNNGSGYAGRFSGLWRSTSAINEIKVFCSSAGTNLNSGTTMTLYGIKAE